MEEARYDIDDREAKLRTVYYTLEIDLRCVGATGLCSYENSPADGFS